MGKMMKTISISSLAAVTAILISGCGATPRPTPRVYYPQKTVFPNGVTYNPTWNGYNECTTSTYNDRPVECYLKDSNGTHGPVVTVLKPDIDATMNSFLSTYSTLDNLCQYVVDLNLLSSSSKSTCKYDVRERLLKANNYEKAYNWGLIDQKTWLLHDGKILEAYQAGLIDKDTADLYLRKQAIDQQAKAARDQVNATNNAAFQAQFANTPNLLNQSLQNSNQFMQQQLQNQTRIRY